MTTDRVCCSSISTAHRSGALYYGLAALIAAVGISGLIHDAWAAPATPALWIDLHALFGMLLFIAVVARFNDSAGGSPRRSPHDIRALSRRLSRGVYLLLYGLMFLNLIIGMLPGATHRPFPASAENFQSYLACGIIALLTIRAMAVMHGHTALREGAFAHRASAGDQRNGRLT